MKRIRCLLTTLLLFLPLPALAQGGARYLEVSVDAGFSKSRDLLRTSIRSNFGAELGIPLTSFLQLGVGHTLTYNTATLDGPNADETIERYARDGRAVSTEDKYQLTDTSANATLRWPGGPIVPYIFGGKLWRKVCQENSFEDLGCIKPKSAWNAGIGLSIRVTQGIQLRAKHTVSPSVSAEKGKFDQSTTFGVTWGI